MMKKSWKSLLTSSIAFVTSAVLLQATPVLADKVDIEPMMTYGESLNQEELAQTKSALGVKDGAKEVPVYINELNSLLQDDYPYSQVYSSTYITPAKNNGKVTVEIVTPKTITAITEAQYQNAAITAGAVDVNIKVASVKAVDGSGALAGVYKSFQAAGYTLNSQNVQVAQNELSTLSAISKENKGKEGFSDKELNAAIAEIKRQIQAEKEKNDGQIDQDQVKQIVVNIINNYHLGDVLSQENIQQIVGQMNQFSQLQLSDAQIRQLKNLTQSLKGKGGELIKEAKEKWDKVDPKKKEEAQNFLRKLWKDLINAIREFFR